MLRDWRDSPFFALLPLILLAVMAALGLVIEAVRYGTLLWAAKVPLAVLLGMAFFRIWRRR
jgi:hypothetical protein